VEVLGAIWSSGGKQQLLVHRVIVALVFADVVECEEEPDAKRDQLVKVLGVVWSSEGKQQLLVHRVMVALVEMVDANLFHAMPLPRIPDAAPRRRRQGGGSDGVGVRDRAARQCARGKQHANVAQGSE
jgi:hypothetical protein